MTPGLERVVLPWFETSGSVTERDLVSITYATKIALPMLDEVKNALEGSLEERAMSDARTRVEFRAGIISEPFEETYELGDNLFRVQIFNSRSKLGPKALLAHITQYLEDHETEPLKGLGRRVRSIDNERYIDLNRLIHENERMSAKRGASETKQSIEPLDPSGESMTLDETIDAMNVSLDPRVYRSLTPASGDAYRHARSLKSRIEGFVKEASEKVQHYYGVSEQTGGMAARVPLDGGWSLRILPYERSSPKYAQMLKGLFNDPSNIGSVSGDLAVLARLSDDAIHAKGIDVERTPQEQTSTVTITRSNDTRSYTLFDERDKRFVRIADVQRALDELTLKHTSASDLSKYDILPPAPSYLLEPPSIAL